MELMHSLIDTLKLVPFLFVVFLILEIFEHKFEGKILKSKRYGAFLGGILGALPQCGFSVAITNLFSARVVTLGTIIAVYLATSDEMLVVMLSRNVAFSFILQVLLLKIIVGIVSGLIIETIYRKAEKIQIEEICVREHCSCKSNSVIVSSLIHTLKIAAVILIFNIIIGYLVEVTSIASLLNNSFLGVFISTLIGFIPNCASSIIITESYLNGLISFGTMFAGLLSGAGVSYIVLFRVNKNLKENLLIIGLIFVISVMIGLFINLL